MPDARFKGMKMIQRGVYVENGNKLHLDLDELCAALNAEPTEENKLILAEVAKEKFAEVFGRAPKVTELVDE